MVVFEDMAGVEQYILSQLEDCLAHEVADEAEHVIQKHIETDVYDKYNPRVYERRGLMKSGANLERYPNGLELTIYDMTPGEEPRRGSWFGRREDTSKNVKGYKPTGIDLSSIVSTGAQGNGHGLWKRAFARPYMENAEKEVAGKVIQILKGRLG